MRSENPTNEFCPNCVNSDKGLNEYPCRNCAISHSLVNHYEPVDGDAPKYEITQVVSALEGPFDKCSVYLGCAVQVLENTVTGAYSVGWTRNPEIIEKWTEGGCPVEGNEIEWR